MNRLMKTMLLAALLALPAVALGAEDRSFKHLQSIYTDDKEAGLRAPEGVACNDKSDLVVADSGNGRLLRYKLQGRNMVGGTEIKIPQLNYPTRLQLTSKGEILALDLKLFKVARLTAEGAFAGYLEPKGVPAPEKYVLRSFKVDAADNVYLLDVANARVLVVDPAGKYLRQLPFPKEYGFISDLGVANSGDIFLVDSVNPAVYLAQKGSEEFKPLTKNLKEYVDFPTYIAPDNRGGLFIVDEHGMAVAVLGIDGSFIARRLVMGWKDGQLNYPAQLCMAGNTVFLADRNNNKVQVFELVK